MSKFILHAGMNKTGSSSIQQWLGINTKLLSERFNLTVLRACVTNDDESEQFKCNLVPVDIEENSSNDSNQFVQIYNKVDKNDRLTIANGLAEKVYEYLDSGADVIISAESFYNLLAHLNADFVNALIKISSGHEVLVTYYVRPQHSALEAAWCQWGFRSNHAPSKFLYNYQKSLDYHLVYKNLKRAMPEIHFHVRPYRVDMLDSGNVIDDFVKNILRIENEEGLEGDVWINKGIPLEVANILAAIPNEKLWSSPHDNKNLNKIKSIINSHKYTMTEDIELSRKIMKNYCYNKFEESNKKLIEELGWGIDHFIDYTNSCDAIKSQDLSELDNLWKCKANTSELEFIYQLVKYICKNEHVQ